jgi:hypothetical protein
MRFVRREWGDGSEEVDGDWEVVHVVSIMDRCSWYLFSDTMIYSLM